MDHCIGIYLHLHLHLHLHLYLYLSRLGVARAGGLIGDTCSVPPVPHRSSACAVPPSRQTGATWEILLHAGLGGDVSMPALGMGGGVKSVVIEKEKM